MKCVILRTVTLLKASCIGALAGIVTAIAGLKIIEWNVARYGAEYSSYQFEFLAVGALPGMLIAENRWGSDFQLGEVLHHTSAVMRWNAVVFSLLGAGVTCIFWKPSAKRHSNLPR
jgi:hypothetical protein